MADWLLISNACIFMHAARQWEDWRVSVLADWAREIHQIVKAHNPQALVGNYQVAWKDDDLASVRRRCLGLDFNELTPFVDAFSPMLYHGRSGKTPAYVKEYVDYFGERFDLQRDAFPGCGRSSRLTTNHVSNRRNLLEFSPTVAVVGVRG